MSNQLAKVGATAFLVIVVVATAITLTNYPGRPSVYLLFSLLLNALLVLGFTPTSIFFDTYMGVFLWLGFWLKLTVRVGFMDGHFNQAVGDFDYSAGEFDHALLVTCCGVLGLLAARVVRQRFMFDYRVPMRATSLSGLKSFYGRYRVSAWLTFSVLVILVSVSNFYFGIYQRGSVPRTYPPFGIGGVYTWLLLFGLASISATMVKFELELRQRIAFAIVIACLLETFLSNVSMLSRGMLLNAGALMFGTYVCFKASRLKLDRRTVLGSMALFICLFVLSVWLVTYLRANQFYLMTDAEYAEWKKSEAQRIAWVSMGGSRVPYIDRWVGMEGVMSVASYPKRGWDLWDSAWAEDFSNRGTSFYDAEIAHSAYTKIDLSNRHFISMPGVLAFAYYPDSYLLLIFLMFLVGVGSAGIEFAAYRFDGGNLIFCSLIALVVASRWAHFGYAPKNSHALFGAIALTMVLIYVAEKLLTRFVGSLRAGP